MSYNVISVGAAELSPCQIGYMDYELQMGGPPPAPHPTCGEDPSPETSLGCEESPGCD